MLMLDVIHMNVGAGETNERGERLLEFARKHKITMVNNIFSHKISIRTTWHSPNGVTLVVEKHLEHQTKLCHNFIDFKKAFERDWHEGFWRVLKEYNINNRLIEVIKLLYDEARQVLCY